MSNEEFRRENEKLFGNAFLSVGKIIDEKSDDWYSWLVEKKLIIENDDV